MYIYINVHCTYMYVYMYLLVVMLLQLKLYCSDYRALMCKSLDGVLSNYMYVTSAYKIISLSQMCNLMHCTCTRI